MQPWFLLLLLVWVGTGLGAWLLGKGLVTIGGALDSWFGRRAPALQRALRVAMWVVVGLALLACWLLYFVASFGAGFAGI